MTHSAQSVRRQYVALKRRAASTWRRGRGYELQTEFRKMRTLFLAAILLANHLTTPLAVAQSAGASIGVSAQVVAPDRMRLGDEVKLDRRGGRDSISTRVTLTQAAHPHLVVRPEAGDPPCSVTPTRAARGGEWEADLRCTPHRSGPQVVRLLIVPVA